MAEYLINVGYCVNVITAFPYYPQWKIRHNYNSNPRFYHETYKGIDVFRFKQFTPTNPSFSKRILHMLHFTIGSFYNITKVKKTDYVISIIPFTTSAWLGQKLALKTGAKHWIHIQDFEFDAAIESGVFQKGFLAPKSIVNILNKRGNKILDSANIVSTISYAMLNKLNRKTKSETFYFPNWVDTLFINPKKSNIAHRYIVENKFNILYSGNIGNKQDWPFLQALIKNIDSNKFHFIIVGDGSERKFVEFQYKNIKNVTVHPPIPYDELNDLLCNVDCHILFQKTNVLDTMMPSKLLGMMASSRPSIVSGNPNSEISDILQESEGGKYIGSNTLKSIKCIEKILFLWYRNKNLADEIGQNARKYVVNNYARSYILNKFKKKLDEI